MKTLIFIVFIFCLSRGRAQVDTLMLQREDQLVVFLKELRAATTNKDKEEKNKVFKQYLFETIQMKNAMNYSFARLSTVGTVSSEDGVIRMFNWNIEQDDQTQKYYCYILRYDERKKNYVVSELVDNSFMIPARPEEILEATDWYGALYYKIIPFSKGNKQMYTLLGYDANTSMSNIKLIDVLSFSGNNPRLGSPVFKMQTETLKRVFFEHSEKAYMSLKYEKEYERIIYDHLSPETPSMTGFYSYYVPDFSYDAFVLVKDKWILQENVVGVNNKTSGKVKMLVLNEKTGEIEGKELKEKWISPNDPDAAAGGVEPVRAKPLLPSEVQKNEQRKKWFTKKSKTIKPDTYSTYPYSEINRRKKRDGKSN
jgi:hypothetical protein